jgi:hypothetical protein
VGRDYEWVSPISNILLESDCRPRRVTPIGAFSDPCFVAVEVDRSSGAMRIFHLALLGASDASLSVLRALRNKAATPAPISLPAVRLLAVA